MIERISRAQYNALNHVNFSTLKHFHKSPAHYLRAKEERWEPTKAQTLGLAVHALILEPESFPAQFAVAPIADGRTKEGKAAKEEFRLTLGDRKEIPQEIFLIASQIADAVRACDSIATLLKGGAGELTVVSELCGVGCKSRLDLLHPNFILDIKTTMDAQTEAFSRTIPKYMIDVQAAFYTDMVKAAKGRSFPYILLVIETEAPYDFRVFHLNDDWIERGRIIYTGWLQQYKTCVARNEWPGYPKTVQSLTMPPYLFKERHEGEE